MPRDLGGFGKLYRARLQLELRPVEGGNLPEGVDRNGSRAISHSNWPSFWQGRPMGGEF
ncbi:hypothetical protein Psta_0555 [Pirellula staleyi DSM 6068]|uniref:Uncharacterized protein n=1 Tax=Pirellula staleyi (strain ATCC 27377 / DSM 6068 / ICPB 4128) TaxID=530564 RepID=D2R494_PIRSD|nr:hypothetical protein Psta_0555 [Pirellula staleyi DSM 6068]